MSGLDPPSKRCWTFGVRTDWRIPNPLLYVSDLLLNPVPHGFHAQVLRAFMEERLPQVVYCGPPLVSTYLGLLSEQLGNTYWHQVLNIVASFTTGEALDWLDGFHGTNPPRYLQPSQDFEEFVRGTVSTVLEDDTSHLKQALSLLERSGSYLWVLPRSLSDSRCQIVL